MKLFAKLHSHCSNRYKVDPAQHYERKNKPQHTQQIITTGAWKVHNTAEPSSSWCPTEDGTPFTPTGASGWNSQHLFLPSVTIRFSGISGTVTVHVSPRPHMQLGTNHAVTWPAVYRSGMLAFKWGSARCHRIGESWGGRIIYRPAWTRHPPLNVI